MKKLVGMITVCGALLAGSSASASPIYAIGDQCPATAGSGGSARQYYVTQATACMWDDADPATILGNTTEANLYLNSAAGLSAFGTGLTGWVGLGQNPLGFSFTTDAGNDDGTFTINNPLYNQFVVGVKDGGSPKFALFLLSAGVFSGDWGLGDERWGTVALRAVWPDDAGGHAERAGPGTGIPGAARVGSLGFGPTRLGSDSSVRRSFRLTGEAVGYLTAFLLRLLGRDLLVVIRHVSA